MIRLLTRIFIWMIIWAGAWMAGFVWFIGQIPITSVTQEKPADAIVVLTGSSGRLEHGLELLAQGKGKALFISGTGTHTTKKDILNQISPKLREKLYAMEYIPLFLGNQARNTIGNAEETKEWIEERHYKSILLVTSNYHLPRSLNEFKEAVPSLVVIPAPVIADDFNVNHWLSDANIRTLLFSEYHKYIASEFRHWFVSVTRT